MEQQLQQENLTTEDWGGEIIAVEVSASTGAGIDDLMEYITLQSEILELKAEPALNASGYVVEAQMEKGMGATATVLVTNGTLEIGDVVVCGHAWGRMKALISDTGVSSAQDFESTFGIMMGPGRPNPAAGPNSIAYELPQGSHVSIKVYDAAGRHVRTVVDSQRAAGAHQAFWDGRDSQGRSVSSGIYFYELKAEGQRLTQKVLQVR